MKKKPIYNFFKRLFDIICSFLSILLFIIPFIIIGITIKIDSKGKIFFKQERVGKNKKLFKIIKFRTMYTDTDPNSPSRELDNADSHITKVGAFLRKTSIDELPQLFNIFIGQMSFVGPRPVVCLELDLINERDKYHANEVRPGLTGLAQVVGRDKLDATRKAELDGEYVSKRSMSYDLILIFKTFIGLFKRDSSLVDTTNDNGNK